MKGAGELHQRRQRRLTFTSLKHADEVPFELSLESKLLLRQPSLLAQVAQCSPKNDRKVQYLLQLSLEKFGLASKNLSANYRWNFIGDVRRLSMFGLGSVGQGARLNGRFHKCDKVRRSALQRTGEHYERC